MNFRRFWMIQAKSDGRFLTEELGFSYFAEKAGRLYDPEEAIETARFHLDDDYKLFSAWEIVQETSPDVSVIDYANL